MNTRSDVLVDATWLDAHLHERTAWLPAAGSGGS